MSSRNQALWSFAVAFYDRPGVRSALLALQDRDGLDVPILITLLHCGRQGVETAQDQLRSMMALSAQWQTEAIGPLRQVRRALKPVSSAPADPAREALRSQVKAAELTAERLLLTRLEPLVGPSGNSDRNAAISANLGAYLAALNHRLSAEGQEQLALLAIEAAA